MRESRIGKLKLFVVLLLGCAALGQTWNCGDELARRWNKFAGDANAYVAKLNSGVVDVKLRARLDREWRDVTTCGCW